MRVFVFLISSCVLLISGDEEFSPEVSETHDVGGSDNSEMQELLANMYLNDLLQDDVANEYSKSMKII